MEDRLLGSVDVEESVKQVSTSSAARRTVVLLGFLLDFNRSTDIWLFLPTYACMTSRSTRLLGFDFART